MFSNRKNLLSGRSIPFILFFLACCYIAVLLSTIQANVFFSGDAGLKYLALKQMNSTGTYKFLFPHEARWVEDIWSEGYYPFKPPFVYEIAGEKIVSFPPYFQWLNLPLYRWIGFNGIYIIPCLSLMLLWLWFIILLFRCGVHSNIISAGFILLAFSSPLTLYGATYWEHTLAVLLTFGGVVFFVASPVSMLKAFLLGLLAGSAVWFRPETALLSGLYCCIAVYNDYRKKGAGNLSFLTGCIALTTAFFICNKMIYGYMLGAHSFQIVDEISGTMKWDERLTILAHINARLLIFFPAAFLFFFLVGYIVWKKPRIPPRITQLTVITICFMLAAPFILPNAGGKQWGPRYFLPVVPLMLIVLCLAASRLFPERPAKGIWVFLVVLCIAYGSYLNVYVGGNNLNEDYSFRVRPGMNFLKHRGRKIVVIQNQFIAQEFAAMMDTHIFFLAERNTELFALMKRLRSMGNTRVTYITSSNETRSLPNGLKPGRYDMKQIGSYYFAEYELR